jgi:tetrahydromethanopterin S-methyltransferase subunit C
MPISKTEIAKTVVGCVIGAGTSKIVKCIIDGNVHTEKKTDKATTSAASLVLGWMAADATKAYTDAKIDSIVNWWETNVKPRL